MQPTPGASSEGNVGPGATSGTKSKKHSGSSTMTTGSSMSKSKKGSAANPSSQSAPARTTTSAPHRAEGKVGQTIIRWGLGVSEAFRMRFLSASNVDHCAVSFDHRNRRQAQAVTRISVSDPQHILCSSSGTGDFDWRVFHCFVYCSEHRGS
jgi:hypothetical protein